MKKSSRGGYRENAGRKPIKDKKYLKVAITSEQYEFISKMSKQENVPIAELVRDKINFFMNE